MKRGPEWQAKDFRWRKRSRQRSQRRRRPWQLLASRNRWWTVLIVAVLVAVCVGTLAVVQPYAYRFVTVDKTVAPSSVPSSQFEPTYSVATPSAVQGSAPVTPVILPTTPTASATPMPQLQPTDTPAPAPIIVLGSKVTVGGTDAIGLSLRQSPSSNQPLVHAILRGEQLTVVDGPQSADGYIWWKVRYAKALGWASANLMMVDS